MEVVFGVAVHDHILNAVNELLSALVFALFELQVFLFDFLWWLFQLFL